MILNASISKPKITYDEFIGLFEDDSIKGESDLLFTMASDDIGQSLNILGRTLTEDDVQDDTVKAYIIGSLEDLSYMHQLPLKNVPLICSYLGSDKFDLYEEDTGCKPKKKASTTRRKFSDKEQDVLKHRNTTVVTPTVAEIARRLFNGALEVAGSKAIDADVAVGIDNVRAHHSDPTSMVWGPKNGAFYQSVIMDDVEYFVSQDVMVNPGEDDDKDRARHSSSEACQSPNVYANRLWFCRICYFFEDIVDGEPVKMFHGQWFLPGSKTILQETAHSKSVYLLYQCADMPVASIIKECKVKMTAPGDTEIKDDARPDANDFHCSLAYDEKTADFFDIPGADEIREILNLVPHSPCLSCGIEKQKNDLAEFTPFAGGFARYGVEYHRHDFVYMRPQAKTGLLDIAQIIKIDNAPNPPEVTVQLFGRCDGLEGQKRKHISSILASDERQLYLRTKTRVLQLDDDNCIDGQCYVRQLLDPKEIEDWLRQDDHFFVLPKVDEDGENLRHCKRCYQKRLQKIEQDQTLLDRNGAITCLELFSGAGGLGTGMDMSGFVETKYAIEFSPSAAQTYQANHTNATVYCQDSNLLLKNAITAAAGKDPEPLISNDGVTVLPPMPKKNSIDFISGGPPCQSFSRANHNPRADDIRSTLPANMLSFVEHYEPRYFLLENVVGLLHYRFLSIRSKDKRSLQGGINAGMVKFIMRTLIALGYQVRFKVLQAGQYGAPQSRRRVIFWGAKRGFPIPDYPVPIYAFDKGMNSSNLPTARILPVSRSRDPDDPHQCAPLRAITVNDAISDLPPFDWINPHKIIPIKDRDRQERKKRVQEGISQFSAVAEPKMANLPGFPEGVEYESEPLNRYQQWLRRGKDGEPDATVVQAHYTQTFGSRVVEATTTVPLRPMAYHKHLPLVLQPDHAKPVFYGRMDGDNQFNCAMTQVAPNQKGWVLHPSQKRIISVRECARAQGFPDYYDFQSADDKPQKMVINTVQYYNDWRLLFWVASEDLFYAFNLVVIPLARNEFAVYACANANVGGDAGCTHGMYCGMAVVDSLGYLRPWSLYKYEANQLTALQDAAQRATATTMPSTALQSRISAFESIANGSSLPQPVFDAPLSPPYAPRKRPPPASPSPSPPNLGRKTSLIDLKDWIVDDGPSKPGFKQYARITDDSGRTPTQLAFESKKQLVAPLINFESPPRAKAKPSAAFPAKAPPLPPRKPSYTSLRSVDSATSTSSPGSPLPSRRSDTLTIDHTYPPLQIDSDARSRNSSGHAPASSISSFHSVSLSSDTDPSTPGSGSSNYVAFFPIDRDSDHKYDPDSVSLGESYEEVSTPSIASPALERIISLDWEKAMAKRNPVPPKLPQRPSSTRSTSTRSTQPALRSPPKRQSSSPSSSGSSATARRAPPPPPGSRSSDRSSVLSMATTHSVGSNYSYASYGQNGHAPRPPSNLHLKTKRPTPVPAAARARYQVVFDANIVQQRKAEKRKEKEKPALLSPTEARGTRRAAGWRGLSVDLITGGNELPASPTRDGEEDDVSTVVEDTDELDGRLVKKIWRRSRLDRSRLSEIWNECDTGAKGSLNRDAFVKGMWRIDEELRRAQTQALKSPSGSLRSRGPKPPVSSQKPRPILR
ncbi:hypothetical protein H0H81_006739 [Sphagnurus paluster]|uniref:Cytosine-specific methyltransferase n=1 Tax=Sphagnurus paluster TaxID=117069 RepID=A0A9P7K4Q7_9AGAR|nr:hypothetical protein H0H81_006739 [Sphagnurus paluster]